MQLQVILNKNYQLYPPMWISIRKKCDIGKSLILLYK